MIVVTVLVQRRKADGSRLKLVISDDFHSIHVAAVVPFTASTKKTSTGMQRLYGIIDFILIDMFTRF
jgi:hypothetical protein